MSTDPDLGHVCEQLVGLANERGGPDNITVVAVRFDGEGLPLQCARRAPGYHELLTSDERPALQPTAAFPAASPLKPAAAVTRTSRTGIVLTVLAVAMGLLGIAIWKRR